MKTRGYFGIGIFHPKTEENIGTLWRSAYQMGAAFVFVIGKRYKKQSSDTYASYRHIPLYEYKNYKDFRENIPYGCQQIGIEFCEKSRPIKDFTHPQQAVYILGSEDGGLSNEVIEDCQHILELPSVRTPSYNVAVAGSLVMYERQFIS